MDVDAGDLARMLRERLDAARRRVEERERAVDAARQSRGDPAGADDEHDPEGATLVDEWSRLEGLRREAVHERDELAAAQERWRIGRYGVCEQCGGDIPAARLAVRPTAIRCVPCAESAR